MVQVVEYNEAIYEMEKRGNEWEIKCNHFLFQGLIFVYSCERLTICDRGAEIGRVRELQQFEKHTLHSPPIYEYDEFWSFNDLDFVPVVIDKYHQEVKYITDRMTLK